MRTQEIALALLTLVLSLASSARGQPDSKSPLCSNLVVELNEAEVQDLWFNGFVEGMLAGYEAGMQLVRVVGHMEQGPGGRWEEPVRAAELKTALERECTGHPSEPIAHAALVAGLSIIKGEGVASHMRDTLRETRARRLGEP